MNYGGSIYQLLTNGSDPILRAIGDGVFWNPSVSDIMSKLVEGKVATWELNSASKLLVARQYHDASGKPLFTLTGSFMGYAVASWPILENAPFMDRLDRHCLTLTQSSKELHFYHFRFNTMIERYHQTGVLDKSFEVRRK